MNASAGARFRAAVAAERPLQVPGAICAYHAILAERSGFRAIYLSGGGVAAGSLGLPDLGISNLDDVLTDVRRITDACTLPLLVDVDTGFGASAFNVARTVKSLIKSGAGAMHIEDQVGAKRCGHRPGKELVSQQEMVDRIKAAVDARTDPDFVIMARTDALAVEGLDAAIDRARACVEAGADMIFPEAITELSMYRQFADAVGVPILANLTEFGQTPLFTVDELARRRRRDRALSAVRVPRDESGRAQRLSRRCAATARRRPLSIRCRRATTSTISSATTRTSRSSTSCSRGRKTLTYFPRPMTIDTRRRCRPKPKKSVALSGVTAGNTALCTVGRTGNDLHYRGYDILDMAAVAEFEEIAYLLVHGKLPTRDELAAYQRKLAVDARHSRHRCARCSSRFRPSRIRWT